MIAYPTNFPQPSTTFSSAAANPTVRTSVENGLTEQFSRFATGRETFSLEWQLSESELSVFEEWFAETLCGGVLIFGLALPEDGAYSIQPVRFVEGSYSTVHNGAFWWTVSASVEKMLVSNAPTNQTPPVPLWIRLAIDPALSQNLTFAERNVVLTTRPEKDSQTTLRIFPPTDPTQLIYFGLNNQGLGVTQITSEDVAPITPEGVPSWPLTLPNINQNFSFDAKRNASRVDMESGHSRQFSDSQTTIKEYAAEWFFSVEQLQIFQDFFYTTLKAGSLPFWLTLPVDGNFIPVQVRFIGGKYAEAYNFNDTFKVTASVERMVEQTVAPSPDRPFPVFYSPTVEIDKSQNIFDAAGKMLIVNPPEDEEICLYLGNQFIEFGLVVVGLGNVSIKHGAFSKDVAPSSFQKPVFSLIDVTRYTSGNDSGSSTFKAAFDLVSLLRDVGGATDLGASAFAKPVLQLLDVLRELPANDSGFSAYQRPGFELIDVLEELGMITNAPGSNFYKPNFELIAS